MNLISTKRNLFSLIVAVGLGLLVIIAINSIINKTVYLTITAELPADMNIVVGTLSNDNIETEIYTISVKGKAGRSEQTVRTHYLNKPIERLSLTFQPRELNKSSKQLINQVDPINIYNIQINRPYAMDVFISNDYILNYFDGSKQSSTSNNLRINNADNVNRLVSKQKVTQYDYLIATSFGLIFTFGLFFLFRHTDWKRIPAITDMSLGREISSSHEFNTINGLRGIAALLVLFSHTAPGFHAVEVGIAILFIISGFLLSKPFILSPNKIFNVYNIEVFIVKRLKRILPMYYLYIFIAYVASLQMDIALKHLLFIQAEGHLWPMTQIFAFYMLLPFILILTSLLFKSHRLLPVFILTISAYFWWAEMGEWRPFFNGQYFHEFFFYAFLMGVIASYIQFDFIANNKSLLIFLKKWSWVLAILGFIITLVTISWSAPIKPPSWAVSYISQFYMKCILCVIILLLALNTHATLFNRFVSSWLFRSIGVVGFSFYILHGLGMQIVLQTQSQLFSIDNPSSRSWSFMLLVLLVTYFMSVVTYSYIERPFFGFRKPTINIT